MSGALGRLATLREELKAAIDADAEAYQIVIKAYKAARESGDGAQGIFDALQQATNVPLGVAERSVEVKRIAEKLKPITNPNMTSDLTTAIALAGAALEGASANVEINLSSLKDKTHEERAFAETTRRRLEVLSGES